MSITPIKFWVNRTLPAVYDDSLSFYEVICKLHDKINECITGVNTNEEAIEDLDDEKQDLLVSGTNIKTINNTSLLGSGNITINPEPTAYLKSGSVSGNTLTLVNKDDSTVTFTPAAPVWGNITGTLSSQTDLNTALAAKQATLVSGTNIKTVNGNSLLGSGDITITGGISYEEVI